MNIQACFGVCTRARVRGTWKTKRARVRNDQVGRVGTGDGGHDVGLADTRRFQDGGVRAIADRHHVGGQLPLQAWDCPPLPSMTVT